MALYKRGEYWHYDFRFEGKRYQRSTRQRSKREAEKVLHAAQADLARRTFNLPAKSVAFAEISDGYVECLQTDQKPSYVTVKYHLRKNLLPHFGETPIHAVNLELCERYKRKRLAQGAKKATINRELSTLKSILKFAALSGLARDGLGRHARLFSDVESKEKHVLTPDELGKVIEVCNSLEFRINAPYLATLVTLGAYTGLRPSELARLRWENLDLEHQVIRVRKSKTKAGVRDLPMHPLVSHALLRWKPPTDGEWVFPSPRKAGDHIRDFGRAFEKAGRKAGLAGLTPGSLRHTFLTWLDGAEPRRSIVGQLGGHSRERHTEPYLHPFWKDKVAAIKRLPLPAKSTALSVEANRGQGGDVAESQIPQGVVMVGPWGLEPQTSTVSR